MYCVLVKGWKGRSWSFLRGKKNKDEEDDACAIREEIACQSLDELQPANRDVISRSVTGLKLYMVAPFLKSLRSWISSHQPPVAPKSDAPCYRSIKIWLIKILGFTLFMLICTGCFKSLAQQVTWVVLERTNMADGISAKSLIVNRKK